MVQFNATCDASMQTPEGNKQPKKRTDGGAVEREKEELRGKNAEMEKFLEEKDCQIRKLNATIHKMKVQHRSKIQYIKTKEQMEQSSLLRKISGMRKQITGLKERRPPSTERHRGHRQKQEFATPPATHKFANPLATQATIDRKRHRVHRQKQEFATPPATQPPLTERHQGHR